MKSERPRIIISGGGTGGHIYPAIAIANALRERSPGAEVLFVGALGKMEMEKVPKAGYPIVGLPVVGLQRSLSLSNLLFPVKLVRSLLKARQVIREFKPDVAVGVGGFASGPLLQMASLAGIPTLIQEQNSFAGITNRLLARKASKICVAYPGMEKFFPQGKILLTGNPVRKDIIAIASKREAALAHFGLSDSRLTLFVMGGSLGARSINESIANSLEFLTRQGIQIIWQTGKPFAEQAQQIIGKLQLGHFAKAFDFIYEMDLAYAAADAIVSRAGALSVSEICLAGKPAILVPYPHASEDHQTSNAQVLVSGHAALLVNDQNAGEQLGQKAAELIGNETLRKTLSENCRSFGFPDAADHIATEVLGLV